MIDSVDPEWSHSESDGEEENIAEHSYPDHYVDVGKSRLRDDSMPTASVYTGKRISRSQLYADSDYESSENEFVQQKGDLHVGGNEAEADFRPFHNAEISSDDEWNGLGDKAQQSDQYSNDSSTSFIEDQPSDVESVKQEIVENPTANDLEKSQHVRNQLAMWERWLDFRIRVQKLVDNCNLLPSGDQYTKESESLDSDQLKEIENISITLCTLFDQLVNSRMVLNVYKASISMGQPELEKNAFKRKRESTIQEWVQSSLEDVILPLEATIKPLRNETMEKWQNKINAANGIANQKKFKVINQSIGAQIDAALNSEKVWKRTKLLRTGSQQAASITNTDMVTDYTNNYNDCIFDDNDYYQQLLKEFIDSRLSTSDPLMTTIRIQQLKDLQKKKKKVVDTRASKGRKVRYQVMDKIQNFMAAEPRGDWHDEMKEELFSSLFGASGSAEKSIDLGDGFKIIR